MHMKGKYRAIAMTTLCVDIFDSTGDIMPGGEALNFAMHACKYKYMDVAIIGSFGDDKAGKEAN